VSRSLVSALVVWPLALGACVTTAPQGPGQPPAADTPTDDPLVEVHARDAARRAAQDNSLDALGVPPLPGPGAARPLSHLEGCWQAQSPEGDRWLVTYTRPVGGVVLGTTRHLRGSELLMDEVERFTVEADGTLIVTPIANGIPRDSFAWDDAASGPDNAVFQRRGEGFPQTLLYTRVGDELQVVARDDAQALGMKLRPGPCL